VPVVKISNRRFKVGGAANVAKNVAALGAKVGLLGIVGNDSNGEILNSLLAEDEITSHILSLPSEKTISKLRVVSRNQQVLRLDEEERFSENSANKLLEVFRDIVPSYDAVIFSDYDKGALQLIRSMISEAKAHNLIVAVDPKQKDFSTYAEADVITPNLLEFKQAGGECHTEDSILRSCKSIMDASCISNVLLTRSEKGMSLFSRSYKFDVPAEVREVVDVTGAGDTVISVLTVFLSIGCSYRDSVIAANAAAGIVVGRLGASCVTVSEIADALRGEGDFSPGFGLFSLAEAISSVANLKKSGRRIVFTNGCFDILHAGHVGYLEEAKKLGDFLIVGLNSDESVSRLKGDDRPINSLSQRAQVLLGLRSVDMVVPFGTKGDDTPIELITAVTPDVLVKGGDYQVKDIVGYDHVVNNGGTVLTVNYREGLSTTNIISRAFKV
jgi:D-beta-D-heptose 7-phosphate kinase/D-beta-D-heptose 1-phosphate adenosyltransferase